MLRITSSIFQWKTDIYRLHYPILYPITDTRAVFIVSLVGSMLMNIHEQWRHCCHAVYKLLRFANCTVIKNMKTRNSQHLYMICLLEFIKRCNIVEYIAL